MPETGPARKALEKERRYEADFEFKLPEEEGGEEGDAEEIAKNGAKAGTKRLMRKYFTPTEANWGPKARATGGKKKAKAAADDTPL